MSRRFLLEPIYTVAEYDARYPAMLRTVGTLLDAAIEGPPPDPEFDELLQKLSDVPVPPTCH